MSALKRLLLACLAFGLPGLVTAATTGAVVLVWNANTEPDIAGYRVHYGSASAPYSSVVDVATPTATVSNLENGVTYTFAVTAYNTGGAESGYSLPVSYTVGSSQVIPSAILANISSRTFVQTGENVMIGGFIIEGVVGKKVALRAIGPSLTAAGVSGAMADPVLQLVDSTGMVIASNDNWNVPGQEIESYGLAPTDAREAALVATLLPGTYSAIVSGKNATSGVGLFELYDLDADTGRVANISTRSRVETGDNVMIGGFILTGTTSNQVIVRAIGPSLLTKGVTDALLDPTLDLYDSNGTLLDSNDNWRSTQEAEIIATTVAPTDDRESAIVATLPPGAYSAIVRGTNNTTGVALVEVYALN
ncbi:MAG: fibronectin type III domain-containing protein [Chthoniobacterales bacterium]